MADSFPEPPEWVCKTLLDGCVIPAHPLALTAERQFDERHQRALTRYYREAGAGGIAVGVHTTQFAVRDFGLLGPVLELAAETLGEDPEQSVVRISGALGSTPRAKIEARLAARHGYHAALLSLAGHDDKSIDQLIEHCRAVAAEIPLFGFYLQPSVGGRILPFDFWVRFVEIPNVVAIKVAPFDRYQTLEVLRAVAESGRASDVALYTGNDDHIILDLVSTHTFSVNGSPVDVHFAGGLLGHWAVWTSKAVDHRRRAVQQRERGSVTADTLRLASEITDANAAVFDAANNFAGCIAGINEILRRQGLLPSRACLDDKEDLSPGQAAELDRVCNAYPHLVDDEFVRAGLDRWLR